MHKSESSLRSFLDEVESVYARVQVESQVIFGRG